MRRLLAILFAIALTTSVHSQDYLISFEGSGDTTIIDSVIVNNITQGTSLIVDGSDTLRLVENVTGLKPVRDNKENILYIYPNPAKEYCTVEFEAPQAGYITTEVYDISGKKVLQKSKYFEKGTYLMQISGLGHGVYSLKVKSTGFNYTGKIVSQSNTKGIAQINYTGQTNRSLNVSRLKSKNTEVQMQYNTGDRLKLTGISGNYSTVVIDIPTESKSIPFNFIACTDIDGNNYPIVIIGAQTWMAENLKVTHYFEGTAIPLVEDNSTWKEHSITDKAYCYYDNNSANGDIYGAIYTWAAAMNGASSSSANPSGVQGVCPTDWHLPSDTEWQELEMYLGLSQGAASEEDWRGTDEGDKLKETGTTHWDSPNTGATNESGFTALPGGGRDGNSALFGYLGIHANFWDASRILRGLGIENSGVYRAGPYNGAYGFSVRCVKDN